jgi:hypothetical protein
MTSRIAFAGLLAVLALPAGALAKEPVKATVCGAGACVTSTDKAAILPLVDGGPPIATPPAAGAPAYRVRTTIAAGRGRTDSFTTWISPRLRLIRGSEGTWMRLPAATLGALRRVAKDLPPFPAGRMPIGGKGIDGDSPAPQTYRRAPEPGPVAAGAADWTVLAGVVLAASTLVAGTLVVVRRRRRAHARVRAAVT